MAFAANLAAAAALSYEQGSLAWYASTIETKFRAFITTASGLFEDARPNDRCVGDWIIPMWAMSQELDGQPGQPSSTQFNSLVTYLYWICIAAAFAEAQNRITALQATTLLAAWNTNFGT